jgi:DNA-binding response OmpR family regulator
LQNESVNVLLIDDDEDDYVIIHDMLRTNERDRYRVEWISAYQEAKERLKEDQWDVILVDYDLGTGDGLELIQLARQNGVKAPLIMVTGRGRYELDVEAMQSGAADYLPKDMLNPAVLERVIRYAIERSRLKETLESLVQERTQELQTTIEELRITEEELRTQHDELLQISEERALEGRLNQRTGVAFPIIEIVTDPSGVIMQANNEALHVMWVSNHPLEGKLLSFFIDSSDRKRFMQFLARLNAQAGRSDQFKLRGLDGFSSWCFTVQPIQKENASHEFYWLIHPVSE